MYTLVLDQVNLKFHRELDGISLAFEPLQLPLHQQAGQVLVGCGFYASLRIY